MRKLRVILLDNEPLMLEKLEKMLHEYSHIQIVGVYTSPRKALTAILENKPDVIFLEIDIAILSGLEIAELVMESLPNVNIVFTSVYSEFAIQAFDLGAVDYLIKPIRVDRLKKTIQRIKPNKQEVKDILEHKKQPYAIISCFGSIKFKWSNEQSYLKVNWRTKKTKELFAYLIHNHGKTVRKDMLVDLIWPHVEWDQGRSLLYTAIYHIRKVLESIKFNIEIENSENTYTLLLNDVKLDVKEWEKCTDLLETITKKTLTNHINVIKKYKGDYLGKLEYPWARVEMKRLRSLWLYHVKQVTDYLVQEKQYMQAIELYHYVQEINPLEEESYFCLMKTYHEINEPMAVTAQFEMLKKELKGELGIEPNLKIIKWYRKWKNKIFSIQAEKHAEEK